MGSSSSWELRYFLSKHSSKNIIITIFTSELAYSVHLLTLIVDNIVNNIVDKVVKVQYSATLFTFDNGCVVLTNHDFYVIRLSAWEHDIYGFRIFFSIPE